MLKFRTCIKVIQSTKKLCDRDHKFVFPLFINNLI
ncbi:hypothetical protein NTHI1209_00179 [Haemophilus influenzae]|uniref:Uncharacterized protein n=1 Tax=Haemophilus influenzae TaxID=727 RepID=A0A158SUN5_HAEIF|nr:hypothetical protein NTHI1209_00179 [Haemophilus influenzae]